MTDKESLVVPCARCNEMRNATVEGQYHVTDPDIFVFRLLQCGSCGEPILVVQEPINPDGALTNPVRIHPSEGVDSSVVPAEVALSLNEAIRTLERARAYTAASIMCRRTLEAMCADKQVVERNLPASLTKLKDHGFIDQALYEWTTEIKVLGDTAAHEAGFRAQKKDAQDALMLTKLLIEYVYEYYPRFEEFRKRRRA